MREMRVSIPELALVAGTRGVLGVGIGLLLSQRFDIARTRAIGLTLVAVGALTTIPLVLQLLGRRRATTDELGRTRSRYSDRQRSTYVD